MAKGIGNVLEAVQVDEQHTQNRVCIAVAGQHVGQALLQQCAAGQVGQTVKIDQLLHACPAPLRALISANMPM